MTLQDRVFSILSEQSGIAIDDITPATKLADDLAFDSMDAVEILISLEEEFDIAISDDEFTAMVNGRSGDGEPGEWDGTVGDIIGLVDKTLAARAK